MPSIYTRNKETGEWEKVNSGFNYTPAETDPTLSLEGSPADAKATGDAINSLRQEVENIPVPDVSEQINTHNINENAHEDIRSAIPTTLSDLTDDSTHRTVTDAEKTAWNAKSNFSGNYNDLTNKPTIPAAYTHPSSHPASMITGLATVATSGSYNDLTNKPTIPTTVTYTATVTTGWTASGSCYYKDVTVSGITANDNPIVDIACGSDNAANVVYAENICKVFRITTYANTIRVWAKEAIASAFPIQLKVVR